MCACGMCHGTDTQSHCEQGQCYWEEMNRQHQLEEEQREAEYEARLEEEAQMAEARERGERLLDAYFSKPEGETAKEAERLREQWEGEKYLESHLA